MQEAAANAYAAKAAKQDLQEEVAQDMRNQRTRSLGDSNSSAPKTTFTTGRPSRSRSPRSKK